MDIRGGSPGHLFPRDGLVDGVVLSGGSLLGLECGTGVSAEIWKHRQFDSGWDGIPLVKGAIIFDYTAVGSLGSGWDVASRCFFV